MSSKRERAAYKRAVQRMLRSLEPVDKALTRSYRRIAVKLSAELSKVDDSATVVQLNSKISKAFEAERGKRAATLHGVAKSAEAAAAALGASVDARAFTAAQIKTAPDVVEAASARIAKRVTVPNEVKLSRMIRRWEKDLGGRVAREVQSAIQQRRGILGAADKINKLDAITDRLPQYLEELEAAARAGDGKKTRALAKHYLDHVRTKLGEIAADGTRSASSYSLRGPTKRLVTGLSKASAEDVDAVVAKYVKERALWRARVIARTETVRAMRETYVREAFKRPGVVAVRWTLSNRHSILDECDVYAAQNLHNLGPGGYPQDAVPQSHPNCLCAAIAIIDDQHYKRKAKGGSKIPKPWVDKLSPKGMGWLKANQGKARQILGPTRFDMMKRGVNVLDKAGKPLPVSSLLQAAARKKR